ncbi:MAG: hypothetical protein OXL41_08315 [Nitrospinae bacterium]|nr:hypothetical protein [Nitrospinota bacterium]
MSPSKKIQLVYFLHLNPSYRADLLRLRHSPLHGLHRLVRSLRVPWPVAKRLERREAAYGFDVWRGLLTPCPGVALPGSGEIWHAGARWKLGPDYEVRPEAILTEPATH